MRRWTTFAGNITTIASDPAPLGRSTYLGEPSPYIDPNAVEVPVMYARGAHRGLGALSQCPNDVMQYTQAPAWSTTTCKFRWRNLRQPPGLEAGTFTVGSCTTWFVSRDGNGYMMATAAHCVVDDTHLGEYSVDPSSSYNHVCCGYDAAGVCTAGLFAVRAWVATNGYFMTGQGNDGALLWVEPSALNTVAQITPRMQPITYYPGDANLPALQLFSDGYPGNATNKETGQVTNQGCNFATGLQLWLWNTTAPIAPFNANTRQGRDVTYEGVPLCGGHSGGRLLDGIGNAFGIVSRTTTNCTQFPQTLSTFTQIVNQRGQHGVNIAALQQGVRANTQGLQWVVPASGQSCEDACEAQDVGWRAINGGSNNSALCAGFINLPGFGEQWLSGKHLPTPSESLVGQW